MDWTRRDWVTILLLTALAAALRFYQLGSLPPGFQFDEAFNAIDASQVLEGNTPLFLPANAGREVLYTYFQALLGALFGVSVYTLRLASALLGTLAIPVTYVLLRRLLRRQSYAVAAFTALVVAITLWHVHFSRYGIRVISMPVALSGVFGLYWLAGRAAARPRRLWLYAISGALAGLSVWTHPAGRFVPFVLMFYALWLLWRTPAPRRWQVDGPLGGLALAGAVAFLVFLPLGLEFYRHPDFFFGHASEVSVFAERVSGDSPLRTLGENLLHVLGMFSVAGDREWTHGPAGRPVWDLAMSAAFVIGVFLWARRLVQRRPDDPDVDALVLLALWASVMLFPSILSEAAPNYSRTLPSLPALFLPAGLGLAWIATLRRPVAWAGPALATAIVVFSLGSTVYDYFVRFARSPEIYYLYDAEKLDALNYLAQFTGDNEVYLSQLWGDKHATVYHLRGRLGVKSLDPGDTLVLPPPGRGAIYAFPHEQESRARKLAERWPDAALATVPDRYGAPLLHLIRLSPEVAAGWPAGRTPDHEVAARFVAAPALIGLDANEERGTVTLYWRAEEAMGRDLTSFVHLLDAEGRRIGQADKLPGNGSYLTTAWSPGERVIDAYAPAVSDPCVGLTEARIVTGWYELAADSARRPRADAPGDTALAGAMTLPLRSYPPGDWLAPDGRVDAPLTRELTLVGHRLAGADLQPSAPFRLDLFWLGNHDTAEAAPTGQAIAVRLERDAGSHELWRGALAPDGQWSPGEGICRRLYLHMPADLEPGTYSLVASALGADGAAINEATLGEVVLGPSTRLFEQPELPAAVDATLGDMVKLLGAESVTDAAQAAEQAPDAAELEPGQGLAVTLVWQAITPPDAGYKAFVHLLDGSGAIVAQSDAVPAGGYATNRWAPGEVVRDVHMMELSEGVAPGTYVLVAGLYDGASGARLPAVDAAGQPIANDAVIVGSVTLPLQ